MDAVRELQEVQTVTRYYPFATMTARWACLVRRSRKAAQTLHTFPCFAWSRYEMQAASCEMQVGAEIEVFAYEYVEWSEREPGGCGFPNSMQACGTVRTLTHTAYFSCLVFDICS